MARDIKILDDWLLRKKKTGLRLKKTHSRYGKAMASYSMLENQFNLDHTKRLDNAYRYLDILASGIS